MSEIKLLSARFDDAIPDRRVDVGDRVVLRFSTAVQLVGASPADFALPINGDSFGVGATVVAGADPQEVEIHLGNSAHLRVAGVFAAAVTAPDAPTGIGIARGEAVASVGDDGHAVAGQIVDLRPGLTPAAFGADLAVVRGLVAGRLDADGRVDAIVAGDSRADVYLGTGDGTLNVAPAAALAVGSRSVALADVDRNGTLDVAIADPAGGSAVWLNGVGGLTRGSFVRGPGLPGIAGAEGIVAGDFNGDGWPDFAIADATGCRIASHGGSAGAAYSVALVLPGVMSAIAAADLDHDGDLDLVVGGETGAFVLRNSAGVFAATTTFAGTCSALAIGDVDRGGSPDIVIALAGSSSALYVERAAAGGYVETSFRGLGDRVTALALADLDGDGAADLVLGSAAAGEVRFNDGSGGFAVAAQILLPIGSAEHIAVCDIDGDGDLDVLAGGSGHPLRGWMLSGTRRPTPLHFARVDLPIARPTNDLELGDLDRDGHFDLVLANGSADVSDDSEPDDVWLYTAATGTFDRHQILPKPQFVPSGGGLPLRGPSLGVTLVDADGDGALDAMFGRYSGAHVETRGLGLRRNDGAGVFAAEQAIDLGTQGAFGLGTGDFDRDGRVDLLVGATLSSSAASVFYNGGGPQPWNGGAQPVTNPFNAYRFAVGDLDDDGDLDVVCGGYYDSQLLRFAFNQGGRSTFVVSSDLDAGPAQRCVVLADFDRDGRLDLACGQRLGNGDQAIRVLRRNGGSWTPAADLPTSGGAVLDLAHGDVDGDGVEDLVAATSLGARVWLGNGAGGFVDAGIDLGVSDARAVAVGDIDLDGRLDLVVGNFGAPTTVWLQR